MQQKARKIVGVDEAGRGPLAGPVVAAAVLLPDGHDIIGLNDSKKLSAKKRAALEITIKERAHYGIAIASVEEIDRINILQASLLAMHRAVEALHLPFDHILVDGNKLPQWPFAATAIVGGDALHAQISAASILAKEHRDRIMADLARQHPAYAWENNKGYGTAAHISALKRHGPCLHHRRSFAPVAQLCLI